MSKDTLFTNDSGGGSSNSSGQYVQDVFQDVVLPAGSNAGLTDTALTNPIDAKVGNSDVPRFGTKTLWVKDVVLIDDRSKWIDGVPTYRVIWNEDFPAASGYIQSTEAPTPIKLANAKKTVFEMNSGLFGVICKARKVGFFVQGMTTGASAVTIFLDRVSTSRTVDITGIGTNTLLADQMQYNFNVSGAANATDDLHNFNLAPAPARVEGIILYFENTTQDIAVGPGTTYVDKTASTTTVESNLALPSFGSSLGGVAVVTKSQGGAYTLNSKDARTAVSIGQGTNGTNTLNMSVGTGASFPAGAGLVLHQGGGSFFVGAVQSVSTDALTVLPALPFGVSNTVYRSWLSGASLAIGASYMELATSINFTPYLGLTTPIFDPSGNWAIWAQNCGTTTIVTGTTASVSSDVLAIAGSSGFIHVQGLFSAAEFEFFESPGGPFWGTFMVNGIPAFSIATGAFGSVTSTKKQTIFTEAGGGWNSLKFSFGKTMAPRAISKINLYRRRNDGASFGNLASLEKFQEFADRALSADSLALGTGRRVYSDQLFLEDSAGASPDAWERELNENAAGGIRYLGSTTTCTFTQRFYGKNFALIGTAPTGATLTLDGAGIPFAPAFNRMAIGATEMFHTVTYAHISGTSIIEAFDFSQSFGELRWLGTSSPVVPPAPPRATVALEVVTIKDVKSSGTDAGTFTSGAWRTRTLNTLENPLFCSWVALASNQFTLQPGAYYISAQVPGYFVNEHKSKLYDITSSSDAIIGSSEYAAIQSLEQSVSNKSWVQGIVNLTSPTTYEIQHQCSSTQSGNGFGVADGYSVSEVYTTVVIQKLSTPLR